MPGQTIGRPAGGDRITRRAAAGRVGEVMDRLQAEVEAAGLRVFARVDHGGGAAKVAMALGDAELLVFGHPMLGTPAMQADPLAGLYLPVRVLAYQDAEGAVWLAYENPVRTFDHLAVPDDADVVGKLSDTLGKLTAMAAGG